MGKRPRQFVGELPVKSHGGLPRHVEAGVLPEGLWREWLAGRRAVNIGCDVEMGERIP